MIRFLIRLGSVLARISLFYHAVGDSRFYDVRQAGECHRHSRTTDANDEWHHVVKVHRTSVPITTNIRPEMLQRARVDSERAGFRTLRAYLEALIAQGLVADDIDDTGTNEPNEQTKSLAAAYPSSAWALGPAILGNRLVLAVEALTQRIQAGEDVGTLEHDLTLLRRDVVEHLIGLRRDYDREVELRDRRHYGRLGGVE